MSEMLQASPAERFADDYVRTFVRFLDPNLPSSSLFSAGMQETETTRWPLGQTLAFATVVSLSLWGVVAAIVYYCA